MSPPPQPKRDNRSSSPEVFEPDPEYDTKIDVPRPFEEETAETAAERAEAGRMGVKGESTRGRADISLDTLREKTKTRRFDVETPRKINEINFFESPEVQRERFDSLRDVSIVMLANIMHANQNIEQKLDLSNFENVGELSRHLAGTRPGPAENAALHKILELREHSNSEVSRYFAEEWPSIAAAAREIERDMSALEKADLRSKHAPEEKGVVSKTVNFVKKHPLVSLGIALAGAYGLYKIFAGIHEKLSPSPSDEKKEGGAEKKTGFMGWLIGVGAAILAIFGLGRFLGRDGVKKFFKEKMGWDLNTSRAAQVLTLASQGKFKEAWEVAWEEADENSEFHGKMAKMISGDAHTEVSGKTLFELRDEEFEDFISRRAQLQDEAGLKASEYGGEWVEFIGFDSRKKNEEQIAVRGFLKKHEQTIRQIMPVRGETTLEEIFQKLYSHLTGKPSGVAVAAGAAGAAGITTASETGERDRGIERLSGQKKARAIENEKILAQKINFAYITQMNKAVSDREQVLKDLLTKSLKPEEREDVEEKLATLSAQKDQLGELIGKHNSAYLAYKDALERDADEETLILRFTELIEAKELLEEHFDDIFVREDWKILEALAVTHALRFTAFAYRRWLKHGDIRNEVANYLFSKYTKRLSIERIRDSLRELRKRKPGRAKIPTMATLKRRNDGLFQEMNNFIEEIHSGSQGLAAEGITREHFVKMNRLEAKIGEQQRHLESMWRQKNEALKAAIAKGDKRKQNALLKEIQELGNERVRLEFGSTKQIGGMFDRWSKAFRGVGGKPDARQKGVAAFRGFFMRAMQQQRKAEKATEAASHFSRVWARRGKLVFLGASVALGGEILADEKTGRTKAYAQAGLSALPLVGTYMDFHSAFSGKEAMTRRTLDVSDRFISGAFGVAGLATDALTVFGVGIIGRGLLIGLKAGRGMSRAARIAKVVEAAKAAKAAKKAEVAAGAYRGVQILEQAGKWGFRVSLGTALGVPAYMAFTEQAELDVSDEFMKEVVQPSGIEGTPEQKAA